MLHKSFLASELKNFYGNFKRTSTFKSMVKCFGVFSHPYHAILFTAGKEEACKGLEKVVSLISLGI